MKKLDSTILQALNPSDYFTLAMDDEIRRENMPGSLCGFALELDKEPDIETLQARIIEFGERFPVAYASLQQQGKRFFWCQREQNTPLFSQHRESGDKSADFHKNTVLDLINQKQAREDISPISFHLISSANKHTFLLRWVHPFCDARGIDLILKFLCTNEADQRLKFNFPELDSLVNLQLEKYKWWQKIALFFKAKRYITKLDQLPSIIHADTTKTPKQLNFTNVTLTNEQTTRINSNVRKHVGMTGTSLYYIGCFMRALHRMDPTQKGEAYCAPYAFSLRKNKALSPVLANHVGALFAQVPKALLNDRSALFQHLKNENMQVIRKKLDYAFLPVMWAASWLSLEKHGKELRKSYASGTERSSFWFSDIGKTDISEMVFFDSKINSIFHLCQITSPPALAFLSCQFNNRLTFSYNFIEPLFHAQWIDQLHEIMLEELLME